jgi:hypothetical protein
MLTVVTSPLVCCGGYNHWNWYVNKLCKLVTRDHVMKTITLQWQSIPNKSHGNVFFRVV